MMTSSNGNILRVTGPLCGQFTGHRWIPSQRPLVMRSFDVFFDLLLHRQLSRHSRRRWFETPSPSLCRHSYAISLQLRHNKRDGVSNHRRIHCLLNCWFRRRSKKARKLRVTGLCAGNSPVTGEFPTQRASNVEKVSIWWRHHVETAPSFWHQCSSPHICTGLHTHVSVS